MDNNTPADTKYIASCNGGKDSVATMLLALENDEPLHEVVYCEVMFTKEISGEVPEHREFIFNQLKPFIENRGTPFVVVRPDYTAWDRMTHEKVKGKRKGQKPGFPIGWRCEINEMCKHRALHKYWKEQPSEMVQYVGIATDEPTRLARLTERKVSLLAKYKHDEKMAQQLCIKHGLLSPVYNFTHRNGCWFCPNASPGIYERMYNYHEDIFCKLLEIENMEGVCEPGQRLTRTEKPSQIISRIKQNGIQMELSDFIKGA